MKKKINRIFLTVLDSFGIGAAPDAAEFGDVGANTLESIAASGALSIPNLATLGLGSIDGVGFIKPQKLGAAVARLKEKSRGKDTTVGHWELMGIISENPMPTYPNGFPADIIGKFEGLIGRGILCNKPYSGTEVIRDYADEHIKSGKPIVYTSADSVFQIAAHEDVIPPEELYKMCTVARKILTGEHGVGRVIARPFIGKDGAYRRTDKRRDFSLKPPDETVLDTLKAEGYDVIAVGKITDIFVGAGITESVYTHGNTEGISVMKEMLKKDFHGLCFINLVDFDMLYGHRQDPLGYARAMSEFDASLSEFISGMKDGDLLIITADHGCDPADDSTDHTREYVPLIIYGNGIIPKNLGTICGFDSVGRLVCDMLGANSSTQAERIFDKIKFDN